MGQISRVGKIRRYAAHLLKAFLTLGKEPQSFLGAKWITFLLRICPRSKKRALALRILALSPHYFYKDIDPEYSKLSFSEFLEAEYNRNRVTREKIYSFILRPYLDKCFRVLDYGCGPGFLAKTVSANVQKVYAVDISKGVLECAKVINSAENIEYLLADSNGLSCIPDRSLDVVYSIAVIQHVTNDIFENILKICSEKLRPGGKMVFQVQIEHPKWKTEEECRANTSLLGKVKLRYALHCFSKTSRYFHETLPKYGFDILALESIERLCDEKFDDVCSQHLLTATLH